MPTPNAPLAYVYLDRAEVYVHDAEIRSATERDLDYAPMCVMECLTPILVGQTILVTDAHTQGHSIGHLACSVQVGGFIMDYREAEAMQEAAQSLPGPLHAA
jgi:hypothetical protein